MNANVIWIGIAITLLSQLSIIGQEERKFEKIPIDDKTTKIVASPWQLIKLDTEASLRGLHVYSSDEIYASGTGGTIVSSIDGGKNWRVKIVPGAEKLDFRDIQAINDGIVVAMTSGTPARIYRSTNGGLSWKQVFEHTDERVFLDALSFWDENRGVVMGDPITERLFLLRTDDGGKSWNISTQYPKTAPGEAGFAASGTNMIVRGDRTVLVALGSALEGESKKSSRIVFSNDNFASWNFATVPMPRAQSAGIFSICFANEKNGVAVGGDYQQADNKTGNFAITKDGGRTWTTATKKRQPPSGYRSCVTTWSKKGREVYYVTVGPNGTDVSSDLGKTWTRVSNEGFHSVAFAPNQQNGWAVGSDGRLARWLDLGKVKVVPKSR